MATRNGHVDPSSPVTPAIDKDGISDKFLLRDKTDSILVMAEQIARDVVKEAQSVGNFLPSDNIAKPTNTTNADDGTQPPTNANATESFPKTPTTSSYVAGSEGSEGSAAQNATDSVSLAILRDEQRADGPQSTTSTSEHMQGQKSAGSSGTNGMTNGVSDEHLAPEDAPLQNATADASGGSDSDTIAKDAGKGHVRTGSVKKPTFFKSSSVTKNFLAKTASPAPPTAGNKGNKEVRETRCNS